MPMNRISVFSLTGKSKWFVVLLYAFLLSGCADNSTVTEQDGQFIAELALPKQIADARTIEQPALTVKLNDAVVTSAKDPASNKYIASFSAARGRQHKIEILWTAIEEGLEYEIAQAVEWISTPPAGTPITLDFPSSRFFTSFDRDGDRLSNLTELRSQTKPNDSNDPLGNPVQVSFAVRLGIPDAIQREQAIDQDKISLSVELDKVGLRMLKGNTLPASWTGERRVVANQATFVSVTWCYALDSGDFYRLARYRTSTE